jgi:chemotaxis response regulator CheB
MTLKRVLIIQCESLLGAGVESLLTGLGKMLVEGVEQDDLGAIIAAIQAQKPDVIIMDEKTLANHALEFLQFLEQYPQLRVVVVNSHHNYLQVFDKRLIPIETSTDLLAVI